MVQKSLMPKGVDHPRLKGKATDSDKVQKSLMPKGVDHRGGSVCPYSNGKCKNL